MINIIFIAGMAIFSISSLYFYFTRKNARSLNTAFLVSFVTLISYVLMWDGGFTAQSPDGQPIFWTRWLFYAISCSLLMLEISRAKGITDKGKVAELVFLNVIVMGTGTLAAVSAGWVKWIFFILSSIAYLLQISVILKKAPNNAQWINAFIYLGWTVFPIVFFLEPSGIGLIGSALAMGLYLLLDIYTKIIFNLQLKK